MLMNSMFKTILLFSILSVIFVWLGGLIAGRHGVYVAFIFSLFINLSTYFFSDRIALLSSGAVPLDKNKYKEIFTAVKKLCNKVNLPLPKLYLLPVNQANAFATGRSPKNASLAVTEGLINLLDKSEIEAVIAHEISHIKNRDILITTITAIMASAISFLANMQFYGGFSKNSDRDNSDRGVFGLIFIIFMPFAAMLLQLAISRQREYGADTTGANILGSGEPLAKALISINNSVKVAPLKSASPALSSLYIENPAGNLINTFFSTHPPLEERIRRLRSIKI